MAKLEQKKSQDAKIKESLKFDKTENADVDIPRLTSDYLDQTLQIA